MVLVSEFHANIFSHEKKMKTNTHDIRAHEIYTPDFHINHFKESHLNMVRLIMQAKNTIMY